MTANRHQNGCVARYMQVFKARWHGTLVAVKALISDDPIEGQKFERECSMLQNLHHAHIVHSFDSIIGNDGTVRLKRAHILSETLQ